MPVPSIRPATPRDAAHLVVLIDMAAKGLASHFWRLMAEPGQSPLEVGRARALREEGAFTWRNAHLAEVDGEIAGALVGYVIDDPVDLSGLERMNPIIRDLTVLEAQAPRHWYVNVLATYPEHRGAGVGTALLRHADAIGKAATPDGMAIIVASQNVGATRLYERFGYRFVARRPAAAVSGFEASGDWLLLTKPHS